MSFFQQEWAPSWGQIQETKRATYEAATVRYIANKLNLHKAVSTLEAEHDELQFYDFAEIVSFPMWLVPGKPQKVAFLDILERPTKTAAYEGLCNALDDVPEGYSEHATGFVFPLPDIHSKFMVLHTANWCRSSGGMRTILFVRDKRLILESLLDLLIAIGPENTW